MAPLDRLRKQLPDVPPETVEFGFALAIGAVAVLGLIFAPFAVVAGVGILAASFLAVASVRGRDGEGGGFPNPCQNPAVRASYFAWQETTHDPASTRFQDMVSQDQSTSGLER